MAVETVFESMKRALAHGERIELRGFGIFNVRPRKTGIGEIQGPAPRSPFHPARLSVSNPARNCSRCSKCRCCGSAPDERRSADCALVSAERNIGFPLAAPLVSARLVPTDHHPGGLALKQVSSIIFLLYLDQYINVFSDVYAHPLLLLDGLAFSITLMTILLAHELGHYFTCRYYGIDASLPYFLPAPTPIGTLVAFIRIRSPIYTRRELFDVGIAGPLAGFVVLFLRWRSGIAHSRVIPGIAMRGDLIFGVPAIERIFEWVIFPGVPSANISLHPIARGSVGRQF